MPIPRSLPPEATREAMADLRRANLAFAARHPGEGGARQPVHTVYGGAHLFKADTAPRLGELARRCLDEFAPTPEDLAHAVGLPARLADTIHRRVREKLAREPVEDLRVDFEDGYGNRPDAEEDGHAEGVAVEMAAGMRAATLPASIGIRIKPFTEELRERSVRTLDVFLTTLLAESGSALPQGFVVNLAKVTVPEQVAARWQTSARGSKGPSVYPTVRCASS